jgi:uncharacterized RDD family membrane protein YckC
MGVHMESLGESARPVSVAPPGWTGLPVLTSPQSTLDDAPAVERVSSGDQQPTEAALRWRLRAASLDYLIVYCGFLLLCLVLHWRVADIGHLLLLTVAVAAYHFVLESRDGQTIGKRRYGLRVVSVDGGPASPKEVALRSVLRVIDQFPVCYASGLISLVRTGPARRQRIGDVAAGTKVIAVDGIAARRGTPGWMLPTATILAFLASALLVYGVAEAGNQPLNGTQTAQFVAGCERSSGGAFVDCNCLLNRLEADGYVTLNSLRDLAAQANSGQLGGQDGRGRQDLAAAALACRR